MVDTEFHESPGARPDSSAATPDSTPAVARQIVVGVDGSSHSLAALRWALDEGDLRRVGVHVVLSWAMPAVAGTTSVMLPAEASIEAAARAELDTILKSHAESVGGRSADSPLTSEVAEGSPALVLLSAAEHAGLLVVGSRGHGGFAGLLLGSVSQQCVAHAHCPVVVVRRAKNTKNAKNAKNGTNEQHAENAENGGARAR